jgi:tetratricopeptide (TPR) repeat protein
LQQHLKKAMAVAAMALTCSGCTLIGATVPISEEIAKRAASAHDSGDSESPFGWELETALPQQWSRLTKEGRGHLLLGRYTAAEQSLLAAFKISNRFRRSDIRRRVSFGNLERLAVQYQGAHNNSAATRVLRIIANETTAETEFSYPGLSDLLMNLGELLHRAQALEDATVFYQRALDLRIEKSGLNSSTLIEIYQRLSRVEIGTKQFEQAVLHAERSLALSAATLGRNSPEMVTSRLHAASAFFEAGLYPAAEEQYLSGIKTLQEIDPSSVVEAIAFNEIARVFLETNRLDEALTRVERALGLLEQLQISGTSRAMFLDTKAQILAADGQTDSASRIFDEMMTESKTGQPAERRSLFESFESFLRAQNRITEAQEIRRQIDELGGFADDGPPVEAQRTPDTADVSAKTPDQASAPWPSEFE